MADSLTRPGIALAGKGTWILLPLQVVPDLSARYYNTKKSSKRTGTGADSFTLNFSDHKPLDQSGSSLS